MILKALSINKTYHAKFNTDLENTTMGVLFAFLNLYTDLKINMEYNFIVCNFLLIIMFFQRKYQDM